MTNRSKIFAFSLLLITMAIVIREKEITKNKENIKHAQQEIVIQNEIIKDKKIISQRQAVARAVSTNDNLVWLRQNRCKDCGESR